jgi:DNA helicase IV
MNDPEKIKEFNAEFSESNYILDKLKDKKEDYKSNILERIEHHNYRVDDIKESLGKAEVIKKKVDYTKIDNILNNDSSNKTLKRTRDMMNDRDDGYTADNESEIHFPDRQTKEKFLSDVSSAKKDKTVLNTVKEKYESTKSLIEGALQRYEQNQKDMSFNKVDDMRDSLPNIENNKNGSKKK